MSLFCIHNFEFAAWRNIIVPGLFHLKMARFYQISGSDIIPTGNLNTAGDNVVSICHALTANSDVIRWWPGMVGDQRYVNPEKHFIVCFANILASCYGSSGPLSENPSTGQPYYSSFPTVTIRDIGKCAYQLLRKHLGIKHIHLLIGGSMGGFTRPSNGA